MKLIKTSDGGYINGEKIILCHAIKEKAFSEAHIIAVLGANGEPFDMETLAIMSPLNAQRRLDVLAEWLANGEDGIFDIMHTWKSDDE